MTAAHTAVLTALQHASTHGPLVLQSGPLPGTQVGHLHFPTRTITTADDVDVACYSTAVMHELLHLERGPSYLHEIAADEAAVRLETARRLTTGISLPLLIRRDPVETARFLGVDPSVVRLAVAMASDRGVA